MVDIVSWTDSNTSNEMIISGMVNIAPIELAVDVDERIFARGQYFFVAHVDKNLSE